MSLCSIKFFIHPFLRIAAIEQTSQTGIMTQAVRESDTLARWGGEEFIVIAPETNQEHACMLAERIRKSVARHPFPNAAQQPLGIVSLSIGVASRSNETDSPEKLLGFADDAVYVAKDSGRNRTVFCSGPEQMNHVEAPPDGRERNVLTLIRVLLEPVPTRNKDLRCR